MNKHLYRIVFNKKRGMVMAVSEIANGDGKGDGKDAPCNVAAIAAPEVALRKLAFSLLVAFGLVAWLPARAQIAADRAAPTTQQPTVLNAGNGVPLVNIQTPSAAGVSRNAYTQFDINSQGAILNNSRNNSQSQLGGWVQGNPWLATGTARIILNEVNSSNPSQLRGYIEVAGDRAQIVIANPAGITCDGCGFLNANRATLTTGTPTWAGGALEGYRVERGIIAIQGTGLDGSGTNLTDIISRAVQVNAGIWAQELKITTGANQVKADHTAATSVSGSGSKPTVSIDVGQLGGMYAGKIRLVGTEAGVGVHNAGQVGATVGEVVVSADGRLENSGHITGSAGVRLDASDGIINSGTIFAQTDAQLTTRGSIENSGFIGAQGHTTLAATGPKSSIVSTHDSTLAAGLSPNGSLGSSGSLNVSATQQISAQGQTVAAGDAVLAGGSVSIAGGLTNATNVTLLATMGDVDASRATVSATQTLTANAAYMARTDSAYVSAAELNIAARNISNVEGTLLQSGTTDLRLALPGSIDNSGGRIATNGHLIVEALSLNNEGGNVQAVGGSALAVTTMQALNNSGGGTLAAGGSLTVKSASVNNEHGRLSAGTSLTAIATGIVDNTDGVVVANQNVTLLGGDLENTRGTVQALQGDARVEFIRRLQNTGQLTAGSDLDILSGDVINSGTFYAKGTTSVSSSGTVTNRGTIAAQDDVTLRAKIVDSQFGSLLGAGFMNDGSLAAIGDLHVTTDGLLKAQGQNTAAGTTSLEGASIDASDSRTNGKTVILRASSGNVDASGSSIAAVRALSVTAAQTLRIDGATVSADQLELSAKTLSNVRGNLVQTGGGDLTVNLPGAFDNTGGVLTTNGHNLTVSAQTLTNIDGRIDHAGAGTFAVSATTLQSTRGTLASNGILQLMAGSATLDGGQISANQVHVDTATLSNRGGQILQSGTGATTLKATQLDNTGGVIASNGDAMLAVGTLANQGGTVQASGTASLTVQAIGLVDNSNRGLLMSGGATTLNAAQLDNSQGRVTAGTTLSTTVAHGANNTDGTIASHGALVVDAASIDNTRGTLHTDSTADLKASGIVNNAQGQIYAGTALTVQAGDMSNSGTAYTQGDGKVVLAGTLTSTGVLASQGDTTIRAQRVDSQAGSLLAAGLRADGSLAATGDLSVKTAETAAANGQIIAAGLASFTGASVDLSHVTTSAREVFLEATQGSVSTTHALIAASGTLGVIANELPGQTLNNDSGELNAGQLDLRVANLSNKQGRIVQTGSGDARVAATRTLDNTGGTLATNGRNLTVSAQTLLNADGAIQHAGAGTLALNATTLDSTRGKLVGNGTLRLTAADATLDGGQLSANQLQVDTATLSNRGGQIVQTGTGGTIVKATTQLDNSGGLITSNGDTTLTVGALSNQGGTIQASGSASLTVAVVGALDNSTLGTIGAAGALTVSAGSLSNSQGRLTAGNTLHVTTTGVMDNDHGIVGGTREVTVAARSIDNTQGTIASIQGGITGVAGTSFVNAQGRIEAAQDVSLSSSGFTNTAGGVFGQNVTVNAGTQSLDNRGGILAARDSLTVGSGALNNDGGLMQGGGALSINTSGKTLTNTNSGASSGIIGGTTVSLITGDLDNQAGFVGSRGALSLQSGAIINTQGGTLVSQASLFAQADSLDNRGGQVQVLGDLSFNAGTINNTASIVRSGATLALNSGTLINADTQGANQGLEGRSVNLAVTHFDNIAGAVRADEALNITSSGRVNNTQGLISSSRTLAVKDTQGTKTLTVTNTGGTIIANQNLSLDAAQESGDGQLLSGGDLTLKVSGDYDLAGRLQGNGVVNLKSGGTLTNRGTLASATTLSIQAFDIDNTVSGDINSTQTTVSATGTLSNRGIIDGHETTVTAGTLNNVGTGRIYGDHLSINAITVNNGAENGGAGTLAARSRLDIGAQTINNNEDALIFSTGDLNIGGALDGNRRAIGQAVAVNNASATVEALGNVSLSAAMVNNLNLHFSTEVVETSRETKTDYQLSGSVNRYDSTQASQNNNATDGLLQAVTPEGVSDNFNRYDYGRVTTETQIRTSAPAQILAGGNLTLNADTTINDKSRIIAGGAATIIGGTLTNVEVAGERTVTDSGTATHYYRIQHKGRDAQGGDVAAYNPAATPQDITLRPSVYQANTAPAGTGTQLAALTTSTVTQATTGANDASANLRGGTIIEVKAKITSPIAVSADGVGVATGTNATPTSSDIGTGNGRVTRPGVVTDSTVAAASGTSTSPTTLALNASAATPDSGFVIRSVVHSLSVPSNSLFHQNASPTSSHLVETDPRFTNYSTWLSSDYLLDQLGIDPSVSQKRLGDGFYEQKLIREQVAQLTGRRFLDGYSTDEAEYRALMSASALYAKQWKLVPGVALTPEQMAQLTTDIVWLVEKQVKLADGSMQNVLAPQVYVRVKDGDVDGSGALLSGISVNVNLTGNLDNSGTIAGRSIVNLAADNVQNIGGRITGADVAVQARTDLNNIGAIEASSNLIAIAGRDLNVTSVTRDTSTTQGSRSSVSRVASLYVSGGTLVASAGRDANLIAASVANAGAGGTVVAAGRDLNLGTVTLSNQQSVIWNADNWRSDASHQDVGTTLQANNDVQLSAGRDLNARAATVSTALGALRAAAGRDVNLTAGVTNVSMDEAHKVKGGNASFSSTTTTTRDTLSQTTAQGSTLSADATLVRAGGNVLVKGSNVVSTQGTSVVAGNDVRIEAVANTQTKSHLKDLEKAGLWSSGASLTFGMQQQTAKSEDTTTSAAASTVGSTDGSVSIQAGNAYRQIGSNVVAPKGNIDISGKTVDITEEQTTGLNVQETKFEQLGVTLAFSAPAITAIQTAQQMGKAAGQTDDARMKLLALANVGMSSAKALSDMQEALAKDDKPGGISISITAGGSQSESKTTTGTTKAVGSTVSAGGNVTITASGAGKGSHLTIQGSDVKAGNDVTLSADGDVNLLAAKNTIDQESDQSSGSAAAGVGINFGKETSFGATVSASTARGNADGSDQTWTNTHVESGNKLTIASGGDTTLKGATAEGRQVQATVGGSLNLQSVQDTSVYDGKEQNASASVTFIVGFSGSASVGQTKVDANYASVREQSGIRAGDDGFQVTVNGNTDLKGAVISSTQMAIDGVRNSLVTGLLTTSDVQNRSDYQASSVSVSVGTAGGSAGVGQAGGEQSNTTKAGIAQGSVVITDEQAQQVQTGHSADEKVANLNRDVLTGKDTSGGLGNVFNVQKVQSMVQAQATITAEFGSNAAKVVGDYGTSKTKPIDDARYYQNLSLREQDGTLTSVEQRNLVDLEKAGYTWENAQSTLSDPHAQTDFENWREGGALRIAAHAAVAALGGGVPGALGAGVSAAAAPTIAEAVNGLDLPNGLRQALIAVSTTALSAAVGNTASAVSGLNQVANNYLKHDEQLLRNQAARACLTGDKAACQTGQNLDTVSEQRQALLSDNCIQGTAEQCRANAVALIQDFSDLHEYAQQLSQAITASRDISEVRQLKELDEQNKNHIRQVAGLIKTDLGEIDQNKGGLTLTEKFGLASINASTNGQEITMGLLGSGIVSKKSGVKPSGEIDVNNAARAFTLATTDDLAAIRLKYSIPEGNTIAAARTDIPGLENAMVEGLSPSMRASAGLPSLDVIYGINRSIKSPYQNPLFTRHAEEDLFNGLTQSIESMNLPSSELTGKTVDIKISNMSGVCNKCTVGLSGSSDLSGVVQQFSNRYPQLTVRITAEGGNAIPGRATLLIKGGTIVN